MYVVSQVKVKSNKKDIKCKVYVRRGPIPVVHSYKADGTKYIITSPGVVMVGRGWGNTVFLKEGIKCQSTTWVFFSCLRVKCVLINRFLFWRYIPPVPPSKASVSHYRIIFFFFFFLD